MFCSSCGGRLAGGETFCPYCGGKIHLQTDAAQSAGIPQYAPSKTKPGLLGFAKGWTIFTIVLYSAYIAQNLTNLFNPGMSNLLLPALLLLGLMDFGAVLTLRMKAYGFYIQFGAALLFLMLSGTYSGGYMISTSGSITVLVSWIATKKQLDYTFPKKMVEDFILLEGFEKIWVIFITGYLTCQMLLSMINIDYYYFYSNDYLGGYFMLLLCGLGAIAGGALILNKRSWGIWVMLSSLLIRVFTVDAQAYGAVFSMSDAAINRLSLTVIVGLAPALLTWLFTRGQINYVIGRNNTVSTSQSVPSSDNLQRPVVSAPASGAVQQAPQSVQNETPISPTPPKQESQERPQPMSYYGPQPKPRATALPTQQPVTFVSKKTEANGGTYEVYAAQGAKQAQDFLGGKSICESNYYIVVKTPEGNWGKDQLGLYLENLLPYQYETEKAECKCQMTMDFALSNLCAAALGANDNFVATLVCGKCGREWKDGVRYQNKTAVRCHHCGAVNEADTTSIYYVLETNSFVLDRESQSSLYIDKQEADLN